MEIYVSMYGLFISCAILFLQEIFLDSTACLITTASRCNLGFVQFSYTDILRLKFQGWFNLHFCCRRRRALARICRRCGKPGTELTPSMAMYVLIFFRWCCKMHTFHLVMFEKTSTWFIHGLQIDSFHKKNANNLCFSFFHPSILSFILSLDFVF